MRTLFFIILMFFMTSVLFSQTNVNTNSTNISFNDPDVIFNNGLKELQKGNVEKAISLLEELLSYNTDNPNYYIYLGYLYYRQFRYDKALKVLSKAVSLNEEMLIAHILLGEIYYQMNNILEARNEYTKVIEMNPNIKQAHIRLYELLKESNPEKANEHYLKIFQLPPTRLEQFLPDIDKIGNIKLPFNKSILIIKDSKIEKNIHKGTNILNEIFYSGTNITNKEKIIVSVKKNKFAFDFKFLLKPFKNFDKERFYTKIIEFIFISIFLIIYSFIQRKKSKAMEKVVYTQYRITNISKE